VTLTARERLSRLGIPPPSVSRPSKNWLLGSD